MTYQLRRPTTVQRQGPIAVVAGTPERLRYVTSDGDDVEGDPEDIWRQLATPQTYYRTTVDRGRTRARKDSRRLIVVTPRRGSIRELIRTCDGRHWSGVTKGSGRYQQLTHDGGPTVHRLPFDGRLEDVAASLFTFVAFVNEHGALFRSSVAGAGLSLFKQTLTDPIGMWAPEVAVNALWPGRSEYFYDGQSRFYNMAYFDLKCAYPSALASAPVPIRWKMVDPQRWRADLDGFSLATAFTPYDAPRPRPLPLRLHAGTKRESLSWASGVFSGWWPHRDLAIADDLGYVVRVTQTWLPAVTTNAFASPAWRELRQQLRALPGLAGLMGKTADNGLWGMLTFDGTKMKRVRWTERNGDPTSIRIEGAVNGIRDTHAMGVALAATSRVREALWQGVEVSGAVYCDTDGMIAPAPAQGRLTPWGGEGGWARKQALGVVDIKDVQTYRWANPGDVDWHYLGDAKRRFDAASGDAGQAIGDLESATLPGMSTRQLRLRRHLP